MKGPERARAGRGERWKGKHGMSAVAKGAACVSVWEGIKGNERGLADLFSNRPSIPGTFLVVSFNNRLIY